MRELFRRFGARPWLTAELLVASLFASVLALAMPIFVIQVLNRYIAHGIDATLATLASGAVIAAVLEFAFRQARLRLARGISEDADAALSNDGFGQLVGARAHLLEQLTPGQRREAIAGIGQINTAFNATNIGALLDLPFALLFIGALFLLSPALGIIGLVFAVAVFAAGWLTILSLRRPTRESAAGAGQMATLLGTAIREIDTVRAFNAGPFLRRAWAGGEQALGRIRRVVVARQGLLIMMAQSTTIVMSIALISVGALLVVGGELNVGALIGANILATRALQPISRFAQSAETLVKAQQAIDTLTALGKLPQEAGGGTAKTEYTGRLELRDVSFLHPGAKVPLFESLSVTLEPGRTMVVAGTNGAGKTTLARLIAGLIEPGRGEILADGINLRQLQPEWWRRQLVYLPQEPAFLNATIAENLRLNDPALADAELQALIDKVGLRAFIDESAQGIDTMIDDNGRTLSVGIRRRLALARALATGGRLVVLDEPVEGLDREGTEILGALLAELHREGRTIIAFSHDPAAIRGADIQLDLNSKPVPRVAAAPRPVPEPQPATEAAAKARP